MNNAGTLIALLFVVLTLSSYRYMETQNFWLAIWSFWTGVITCLLLIVWFTSRWR